MGNVARTVGTVVNGVSRCMCSLVLFLHPVNMYFCCYALSTLKVSCWLWWLDLSGWPDIALKLEKGEYLIGTQSCLQVLSPPVDAIFSPIIHALHVGNIILHPAQRINIHRPFDNHHVSKKSYLHLWTIRIINMIICVCSLFSSWF